MFFCFERMWLVTIDGFNSWPSNVPGGRQECTRKPELSKFADGSEKSTNVSRLGGHRSTQNSHSPEKKSHQKCEFFMLHFQWFWSSKCECLPYPSPSQLSKNMAAGGSRKAQKEGKPLPPKGTPYAWTLEVKCTSLRAKGQVEATWCNSRKYPKNLLWMCVDCLRWLKGNRFTMITVFQYIPEKYIRTDSSDPSLSNFAVGESRKPYVEAINL